MIIPSITELRFPKSDKGRQAAYLYIKSIKAVYPKANNELIEALDHLILLITYNQEFEV